MGLTDSDDAEFRPPELSVSAKFLTSCSVSEFAPEVLATPLFPVLPESGIPHRNRFLTSAPPALNYVGFCRISQENSGSLSSQAWAIRRFCRENELKYLLTIRYAIESGYEFNAGVQSVVRFAQLNNAVIVVTHRSRFSHQTVPAIVKALTEWNVYLLVLAPSSTVTVDPDPFRDYTRADCIAVSKAYRALAEIPTKKGGRPKKLGEDEESEKLRNRIVNLRLVGYSLQGITDRLNKCQAPKSPWSKSTVRRILEPFGLHKPPLPDPPSGSFVSLPPISGKIGSKPSPKEKVKEIV